MVTTYDKAPLENDGHKILFGDLPVKENDECSVVVKKRTSGRIMIKTKIHK